MVASQALKQVVRRPARPTAIAIAVFVTTAGFLIMLAGASTTQASVRGALRHNFRSAYDIVVRPALSYTPLERAEALVRPNALSGIFGGISVAQWRQIQAIPGVAVAAPVANIGYLLLHRQVNVDLEPFLDRSPRQLFRVQSAYVAQAGLSHYPGHDVDYVYFSRYPLIQAAIEGQPHGEIVPAHPQPEPVCDGYIKGLSRHHTPFAHTSGLDCFSAASPGQGSDNEFVGLRPGEVAARTVAYVQILLAAIDPVEEAKLLHLDRTVVRGRYLRAQDRADLGPMSGSPARLRIVPVLASAHAYTDERLVVDIQRLRAPTDNRLAAVLSSSGAYDYLNSRPRTTIGRRTVSLTRIFGELWKRPTWERAVRGYWWPTATYYRRVKARVLKVLPVMNGSSIWRSRWMSPSGGYAAAPPDNADTQFRRLRYREANNVFHGDVAPAPRLEVVGRYDPALLPHFSPLSRVPLETYYPPQLDAGDARSKAALRGRPLLPTQNLGDYVAQPPLLLTTMQALPAFLDPTYFTPPDTKRDGYDGDALAGRKRPPSWTRAKRPISVIRVRVRGVSGPDAVSRARIEQVTERIHRLTGLAVDITAGSSPRPQLINLPRGRFGRPQLTLREGWSQKGANVQYLRAVDRKSLTLFVLLPLVCGLFVMNAALAAARTRRREFGTLLSLGWPRRALLLAMLAELALVGICAGILAAGLALVLAPPLSVSLEAREFALALPIACLLTIAAGLAPAIYISRLSPVVALSPALAMSGHRGRAGGVAALALVNVRRLPGRTALALGALALGVASFSVLFAIERAFQGSVVGTLLGAAISLRVRPIDFLAVVLITALATLSIGDVLLLSLRERLAETATLRACGWRGRDLAKLVTVEALLLGVVGGVAGIVLAVLAGSLALSLPAGPLALASVLGVGGALVAALLCAVGPVLIVVRSEPAPLLAAE